MPAPDDRVDRWLQALERRHLRDLTFREVARALRALSSTYVERRSRLTSGAALSGAGKRAAFALFYGPLHYLVVREIVRALPGAAGLDARLVDLGCGTGAAGAAWASLCARPPEILGIDRHPWTLAEAARTYAEFGLTARTRQGDLTTVPLPHTRCALLAAFAVNELPDDQRDVVLARWLDRAARGDAVLVVEPIARSVTPWWGRWRRAFAARGGRADEWRVQPELPPLVAKLDRAAGLDHRGVTARSLWLPGTEERPPRPMAFGP